MTNLRAGDPRPDNSDFCPRCGLVRGAPSKAGSITGYLFQDTRCKCEPDPAFHAGSMTQKLQVLKKSERGHTFAGTDDESPGSRLNLVPGAIIGGAYQVKRLIDLGGMGEVYLVHHFSLDRDCALKVIPPDQVTEVGWGRFQQEARAVSKLNHVNIVQVSDLGIHAGCLPFYAMEYVPGSNLAALLEKNGPMPLPKAIAVFKQVCDGVDFAHRKGIIHRDLKPDNIMVADINSAKPVVKILDFGLAKLTQSDHHKQSLTAVGDVFGSPFYMSPEQCEGDTVDNRSDLYSIGCALFECLTGRPPFSGKLSAAIMRQHQEREAPKLSAIAGQVKFPENLEVLMAKLLRKNPDERYQSAAALKADLERIESGAIVEPYESPSGDDPLPSAPLQNSFPLVYIVALAALALVAGGAIYLLLSPSSSEIERTKVAHTIFHRDANGTLTEAPKTQNSSEAIDSPLGVLDQANDTDIEYRGADSTKYINFHFRPLGDEDEVTKSAELLEAEKAIHCDDQPFLRGVTTRDGVSYSHYQFPTFPRITKSINLNESAPSPYHRFSMGYLYSNLPGHTKRVDLSGKIDLPSAGRNCYIPSKFALAHPKLLQNFRNGDIYGLVFQGPKEIRLAALDQSLQVLGKLDIKEFYTVVSLSREQIKSLKCLAGVNRFEACTVKDVNGYLSALRGSQKLENMRISYADLKQEDLDCIAKMPHIKTLQIDASDNNLLMPAGQFARICQLTELTHLYTSRLVYSDAMMKNVAKLKSLEILNFTGDASWKRAQLFELKKALPNCRIYILRQNSSGEWTNFRV